MNRDSVQKLRLDRRLISRRGWLSENERVEALESLPDVTEKGTTLGAASDSLPTQESESHAEG